MDQFKIEEKEYQVWHLQEEIDTFFSKRCKEEPEKIKELGELYAEFRTLLGKTQDIIMEDK
jgi:hypothetical protein